MSIHRRNPKRDGNEPAIIEALRSVPGVVVSQISGAGVPDLLVGFQGQNILMEVKDKSGKLTTTQVDWHNAWTGQVAIVRTVDEALEAIGIEIS